MADAAKGQPNILLIVANDGYADRGCAAPVPKESKP
jgi:hypothetical protein